MHWFITTFITLIFVASDSYEQQCHYLGDQIIDKQEGISSSLVQPEFEFPVETCPCFHKRSTDKIFSEAKCEKLFQQYNPREPLLPCSFLPKEFIECDEPVDHKGNQTAKDELGYGCVNFGGQRYEDVERTQVCCRALDCIECRGNRTFLRNDYPCIKYTNHYFVSTLIYSILMGFLGLDRFCLGRIGTGVGKFLTLGGLGIWWLVDIVLLITGQLGPADGSNWIPTV